MSEKVTRAVKGRACLWPLSGEERLKRAASFPTRYLPLDRYPFLLPSVIMLKVYGPSLG